MHLMLVAQLFLRYCRVPHIKLKLNCNRNHGNMTSLINTTTGGRLAIGYRAHFPLSSHPKLIYLVSSLMRATCGPTTPGGKFFFSTYRCRSDRAFVSYCGVCRYISFKIPVAVMVPNGHAWTNGVRRSSQHVTHSIIHSHQSHYTEQTGYYW